MAVAAAGANTELGRVLQALGFPATVLRYIRDTEGLTTLQDVNHIHKDLVATVFENMSKSEPPIPYTIVQLSRFKTLHSYLRRMAVARIPINPVGITIDLLQQEFEYSEDSRVKEADKKVPFPTEEFKKDSEWLSFKDIFKNYLDSVPSVRRSTPLSYVIRPTVPPADVDATDPVWSAPLDGAAFREDNRLVYTYLEKLTRAGIGKAIVGNYKVSRNGRAAFLALDSQYTGGAYQTLLLNKAWNTLHTVKFLGHTNYTWSNYKSDIDEAYRMLDEAGVALDQRTKVYHLLNGINVDFLDETTNQIRQTMMNDYNAASVYLSSAILTKLSRQGFSRVKGTQGRGIAQVSTKNYSRDEWLALTEEERLEVKRLRGRNKRNGHGGGRGGGHGGGRGGGHGGGRGGGREVERGGGRGRQGGRNIDHGRGASGRNDQGRGGRGERRQIQKVETEEAVDEWEYDAIETDPNQVIEPTSSKWRRVSAFNVRRIGVVQSDEGKCELDSHADNTVLTREARILEVYEGQKFNVYGYKNDCHVERYLCKACVAYDSGEKSYILTFDQCFVDKDLPSSLICTNQLRANGVEVNDVPKRYDKRSSHSIVVGNLTIPLESKGYVSYFPVRAPTDQEIATLEHVEMTGPSWDPHSDDHALLEKAVVSGIGRSTTYPVDPSYLAKLWLTTTEITEATLKSTTLLASKIYNEPRFSSYGHRFRYLTRKHLKGRFWTDTFFANKSVDGFTCAQLFVNEMRYVYVVPMKSKSEAPYALRSFLDNVGIPEIIISDNAREETSMKWRSVLREFGVVERHIEAYRHHQNYAENGVKMVKFSAAKLMERKGVPSVLWDHVLEYTTNLSNRMVTKNPRLEGRTPYEAVLGITPDISAFINFGFYDHVFYTLQPKQSFPEPKRAIGRWLGPSKSTVCDLVYKILTSNGNVIHTSAVEPVTQVEKDMIVYQEMIKIYESSLNSNFDPKLDAESIFGPLDGETSPEVLVDKQVQVQVVRVHPERRINNLGVGGMPERAENGPDDSRGWESARVKFGSRNGTVGSRKRGHDDESVNANPILDRTIYEVNFDDGMVEEISANVIAEAIYSASDEGGWGDTLILDKILDHFSPRHHLAGKSTKWYLLVRWKSGQEDVCRLSELTGSYPVEVAEYAKQNGLDKEPVFSWVNKVLRRKDRVVSKIRTRNVRLEKFGIKVPRSVKEALAFDAESKTSLWRTAIEKEMKNIAVAFEMVDQAPVGYQLITCHMIFDVKMDGTRKARYVAGGHLTEVPSVVTYSSVVTRESIRILLVIAALNDLQVSSCDIQNAYINASPREKVYFKAGIEFGSNAGKLMKVVRALYGLKSSGAAFRSKLAGELREMGYIPSMGDPDVYMKGRSRTNGATYYEYILTYVDDILYIGLEPTNFMEKLKLVFTLKDGYNTPKDFLGGEFHKLEMIESGITHRCWGISMKKYIDRIVSDVQNRATAFGLDLPTRAVAPMRSGYHPELDFTDYLEDEGVNFYQGLIGTLRWLVEMGRMDVAYGISVLSSYSTMPRIGHLSEVLHIFAYLRLNSNYSLVLDSRDPIIKRDVSLSADNKWFDFYPDAMEMIPDNIPKALGKDVSMHAFVDADWGGNLANRRSHTGIVIFLQSAPVIWISKRQKTVETSTYGAELCATKVAVETIEGLRYKLRMFGVPIQGPTPIFCDNESVVHQLTNPESTIKKKHNSIAFHKTRESVAAEMIEVHKVKSELNTADLLTKTLTGAKTQYHTSNLLVKID